MAEELPTMNESDWNKQYGSADDAIPTMSESDWNKQYGPSLWQETQGVASEAVRGVGDILNIPESLNPFTGLGATIREKLGIPEPEPRKKVGDYLVSKLEEAGAITPGPTTTTGEIIGEVARFLPSMAIGGTATVPKLVATVGAGLGSGVAKANDAGPGTQLAASLVGGIAPSAAEAVGARALGALRSVFSPAAKTASAQKAAQEIVSSMIEKDKVVKALDDFEAAQAQIQLAERQSENYLPQYKRTAEIAQDPGTAGLEKSLEKSNDDIKLDIFNQDKAREAARKRIFVEGSPPPKTPEAVGTSIREGAEANLSDQKSTVGELAKKAFETPESLPTPRAKAAAQEIMIKLTQDGQVPIDIDGGLKKLLQVFYDLPPSADLEVLQGFRNRFGEWAGAAGKAGASTLDRQTAMLAGGIRDAIDETIMSEVAQGSLPRSTAKAYFDMRAARKVQGETFESGVVGDMLDKKNYGRYSMQASDIPDKVMASPEAARQTMTALKGQPDKIEDLRGAVFSRVWDKSVGINTQEFNAATYNRQLKTLSDVTPELLTPDQNKVLKIIGDDLASQTTVGTNAYKASQKQSITTQGLTLIEQIQQSVAEKSTNMLKKIPVVGSAMDMISALTGNSLAAKKELINKELGKFVMNPGYAKTLLTTDFTTPQAKLTLEAFAKRLTALVPAVSDSKKETKKESKPDSVFSGAKSAFSPDAKKSALTPEAKDMGNIRSEVLDAVRQVESSGGKYLESHDKDGNIIAKGPYQLTDKTGKAYHQMLNIKEAYDPYDEAQSRKIAEAILTDNLKTFDGNLSKALTAYNSGPKAVKDNRLGPQGRAYAGKVMAEIEKSKV